MPQTIGKFGLRKHIKKPDTSYAQTVRRGERNYKGYLEEDGRGFYLTRNKEITIRLRTGDVFVRAEERRVMDYVVDLTG